MPEWGKAEFDRFYRSPVERWGHPASRPEIVLNYHWFPFISCQAGQPPAGLTVFPYAQTLVSLLGLVAGQAVLIVGCGFNGTGRGLTNLGIRVIGTDLSSYIHAQKGLTEEAEVRAACVAAGVNPDTDQILGPTGPINPLDLFLEGGRAAPQPRGKGEILQEELRIRGSRNSVKNRFSALWPGVSPRYIITEEVLNSTPDNEAALVCSYCQSAAVEWGSTVVHMLSPLQAGATQDPLLNWKTYAGWRSWLTTNGFPGHIILPTVTAEGQGVTWPITERAGRVVAYSGLI